VSLPLALGIGIFDLAVLVGEKEVIDSGIVSIIRMLI